MLKLEDIKKDDQIIGIQTDEIVKIIQLEKVGDSALTIYYKDGQGKLGEQMLFRNDESRLSLAQAGRPWSFEAPGKEFKLGLEAYRISQAALFDPMMAVHTSNIEPLPHQISAVYEAMLPKQPLRFVLADDPGAGKTIMAGLFIRELIMRADAHRILIISPGSLTEQWQDELLEKFSLRFEIFSKEKQELCASGNYFDETNRLICRLDQLSRNESFLNKLRNTQWDLIIVDEAHKLSANYYGKKVNKTKRFQLGELLSTITRHFLLMTATPHNGKEEDFQIWLSLLDSDRFYGKFREGAHKVDVSDIMRRMVKEDLLKFDGTRLFPERKAYTANYQLSTYEASLYNDVTTYVREEMNRADKLNGKKKNTVGFALTLLQRRLASSPEAIFQSLKRRRKRLESRLEETKLLAQGRVVNPNIMAETLGEYTIKKQFDLPENFDELDEELSAEVYELFTEQVVDQATAAETIPELEAEIFSLKRLEHKALLVVKSGNDKKWEQLSCLLQDSPEMFTETGSQTKNIFLICQKCNNLRQSSMICVNNWTKGHKILI
ncbi:RNA helicase [Candidatus Magnetomorum sp. HK-1]|nr:RNA helicase [Candidatus Magnetomorum sp. HK-1]